MCQRSRKLQGILWCPWRHPLQKFGSLCGKLITWQHHPGICPGIALFFLLVKTAGSSTPTLFWMCTNQHQTLSQVHKYAVVFLEVFAVVACPRHTHRQTHTHTPTHALKQISHCCHRTVVGTVGVRIAVLCDITTSMDNLGSKAGASWDCLFCETKTFVSTSESYQKATLQSLCCIKLSAYSGKEPVLCRAICIQWQGSLKVPTVASFIQRNFCATYRCIK